ncbi:MAG: hypothetical protein PHD83_00400 [Caldisericia bacterium]|nr:hypothetical protein [Caldisericia bacterium]
MILEKLSNIEPHQMEWKTKQAVVYQKLKLFFLMHEGIKNIKFILLFMIGLLLQQPVITEWSGKILWKIQFLSQNILVWVIP